MKPTLHVTNWSSRSLHGPGRRWTIMARPRAWEHGDGVVPVLTPAESDLDDVRAGRIDVETYRERYLHRITRNFGREFLPSPVLAAWTGLFGARVKMAVADGDTLCCACSREAAARGECHRVWAARLLADAGWRVVLDGVEVAS